MRGLAIVVVFGCGNGANVPPAPDAEVPAGPLTYTLHAGWWEGPQAPQVTPKPTVHIDGMATELLTLQYASAAAASGTQHTIELRHGDLVVRTHAFTLGDHDCLARVPSATTGDHTYCAYSFGDLRFAGDSAIGPGGTCLGDAFCWPACEPSNNWRCAVGTHCTSIYASIDPIATHLGCVPIGTKNAGDTCTLVTDAAGTHDDCGDKLLCVAGTCTPICIASEPPPNGCMCQQVLGHAPELSICP